MSGAPPRIRVGIGGWTYPAWRGSFFPAGLPHARELHHASRRLTTIEINATFYRSFKAASFVKWRDEVPEDFVFSLKAPRFATHRSSLSTAGESVTRFLDSGLAELGDKLGPILWQLAPTKAFEAKDLGGFLELLPRQLDGRDLRHVLEVRHASFATPDYVALARQHSVATVFTDSADFPSFTEPTGEVVYARLVRSSADEALGYTPSALDGWAATARSWAAASGRDVFVYFINGAKEKEKAPAAAQALIARLS